MTAAGADSGCHDAWLEGGETVLVVDGSAHDRADARTVLERYGYAVLEAASEEEALLLATDTTRPIHLLLTSWIHPTMGGPELAQGVSAVRPDIRVIFAYDDRFGRLGAFPEQEGIVHVIYKPYRALGLLQAVRAVLDSPSDA